MRRRVRPHRDAAPRTFGTFGTFRREVVALLAAKGMSGEHATRTVLQWNDYVKARWAQGKPPCAVSDHLMRWSKEKVVCPCKRGGDPSPRCKVHGRRALRTRVRRDPVRLREWWDYIESSARDNARTMAPYDADETYEGLMNTAASAYSLIDDMQSESGAKMYGFPRALTPREAKGLRIMVHRRYDGIVKKAKAKAAPVKRRSSRTRRDASNPRPGEVYEAKTSGRRWEVVSVEGERVVMRPVGARSEGQLVFSKQSLKGMKTLKGALQSFVDRILGGQEEDVNPIALEAVARRGSDPGGRRKRRVLTHKARTRRRVKR